MEAQEIPSCVNLYKMPEDTHYSKSNVNYAKQVMEQGHYDFIIYQDCYERNERIVVEMSKSYNVPFIVFEHNTPLYINNLYPTKPIDTIRGLAQRLLLFYLTPRGISKAKHRKQFLFDNCTKYVLLSKQYIPELKQFLNEGSDYSKITFINNPISSECKAGKPVERRKELLYVGRLVDAKKVKKIILIWNEVHKQLPDYQLVIVGDGPLRRRLEQLVSKLSLPRVSFEGFQKPEEYYQRAEYMLMTSKFEGWPMTILEAMKYGCITIAEHNFSSLVDIIDDKENGFILPAKCSLSEWAEMLLKLCRRDNDIEMRKRARAKVEQYSTEIIAQQWDNMLKKFHINIQ